MGSSSRSRAEKVRIMNPRPHSIWRTTTATVSAVAAVVLSAVLPTAPIAADAQPDDRGQAPEALVNSAMK
jgi:hypothetical protein